MPHNEDSRVKIPAILHLIRLGYKYLSLKGAKWDKKTNIFTEIFSESIARINPSLSAGEIDQLYGKVALDLENQDLGRAFFHRLIERNGDRLIDFENFESNSFHVVTELPYEKDDDNFRPDVIILINGMPLVFIEVKKPNNLNGIQAEHDRIESRFKNKQFRHFINITQFMIFSNNMEYDDGAVTPLQGAFYASPAYGKPIFNYFREEIDFDLTNLETVDGKQEDMILRDTNLVSIKTTPEFKTNKDPETPTNRILTALVRKDRLAFMLLYSITYVKAEQGRLEKHIMRYPQVFATKAIERELDAGIDRGVIWHTQGSGKTALAYYNVKYLTDYYQKKDIVPKFYFIVDRIDLLKQASREFKSRGLVVYTIDSKEEFAKDIKATTAIHNSSGKAEITVVNIQKFKDDPAVVRNKDYNVDIQRIYFLDEVHRSYNPKGSFLANLEESDKKAIKIGLTGTPLLGDDYNTRKLFGKYIHKYYYNKSIADGYTLRLIREDIKTSYVMAMKKALEEIEILKGNSDKKKIHAHHKFVEPMLDYIVSDFETARLAHGESGIGAMVICHSSDQAKQMYDIFQDKYAQPSAFSMAAEPEPGYGDKKVGERKVNTAALILHDIGTKQDRDRWVEDYKEGKIDILFVYNMLLTGFDAKRLKKLYLGRVIKSHNLLQALTRVNRTYKDFRYGYVVDFANIESEFDKTNKAYFDELQSELGDEMEFYSDLFKTEEEIAAEIEEIKEVLWDFDTSNREVFQKQISAISDRDTMLKITKALNNAKSLYNIIRYSARYESLDKLDFSTIRDLSSEADKRLAMINKKESLEKGVDTSGLLNTALEEIVFGFTKVGEDELKLADELKDFLQKTREGLNGNFDPADPEFISLKEELERLFKKGKLSEVTKEEMEANTKALEKINKQSKELSRKNELLRAKYDNDKKYARLHKRLMEKNPLTESNTKMVEALSSLKKEIDDKVLSNSNMMDNESYVSKMMLKIVISELKNKHGLPLDANSSKRINKILLKEYIDEYNGVAA